MGQRHVEDGALVEEPVRVVEDRVAVDDFHIAGWNHLHMRAKLTVVVFDRRRLGGLLPRLPFSDVPEIDDRLPHFIVRTEQDLVDLTHAGPADLLILSQDDPSLGRRRPCVYNSALDRAALRYADGLVGEDGERDDE